MASIIFSLPMLFLYSILFAVTMKIADLLDEHGMKWFKGSTILFGILWGVFGALLISGNNLLAVFYLALLIQWILRYRIDYLNHGIGSAIMLVAFLYNLPNFTMDWLLFLSVFIVYTVYGLLNDLVDSEKMVSRWNRVFKIEYQFILVPIILTVINSIYWIVLVASILHLVPYEITRRIGMGDI